ncbi:MAG: hypothetical protein FE037_03445 [Thermoplasmata archaeon]|nr:MAG: hypothetical protein FE037_03445 [Thermoplasmata archaeon]
MASSRSRVVLLDTSILFSIFEKKLPLLDDVTLELGKVEFVIPESVINELKKLSEHSKGSKKRMAKAILEYIRNEEFQIVKSEDINDADRDLVLLARRMNAVVATVDKDLIKLLKRESIDVITWRYKRMRLI